MAFDRSRADRLSATARLIRERDLAALEIAAAARDVLASAHRALEREVATAREAVTQATASLGEARACDRLAEFATHRRAALNLDLAKATATWLAAREAASRSTGRLDVLENLAAAMAARSRKLRHESE